MGAAAARRAAEMLGASLNVTATVYGADDEGEFVYGVFEPSDGAGEASAPSSSACSANSAAASLSLKDQLIAEIPEDSIRGFASLAASLGYFVSQHKQVKRSGASRIGYATLFRVFCGDGEPGVLSLPANEATLALLSRRLCEMPGWVWLSEIAGARRRRAAGDQPALHARKSHDGSGRRAASGAAAHRVPWRRAGQRRPLHADLAGIASIRTRQRLRPRQRRPRLSRSRRGGSGRADAPSVARGRPVQESRRAGQSRPLDRAFAHFRPLLERRDPQRTHKAGTGFHRRLDPRSGNAEGGGTDDQARPVVVGAAGGRQVDGDRMLRQRHRRRGDDHHRRGGRAYSRHLPPGAGAGAGGGDPRRPRPDDQVASEPAINWPSRTT